MRLGIILLTYNRFDYAERTLRSVLGHLKLDSANELQVHIASDGDSSEYIECLRQIAGGFNGVVAATQSNSQRKGYGANYNLALQTVHASCEAVLPLEDDWELQRTLDIDSLLADMKELEIGCARLGYVGFTQTLKAEFATANNHYWLKFDPDSAEPHVFAGHPRLETRAWERTVGPWPEDLKPGATEFAVAHLTPARTGVAWPLSLVHPSGDLFHHIGALPSYER